MILTHKTSCRFAVCGFLAIFTSWFATTEAVGSMLSFSTVSEGYCSARHLTAHVHPEYGPVILVAESGVGPDPIPDNTTTASNCLFSEEFGGPICYSATAGVRGFSANAPYDMVDGVAVSGIMSFRPLPPAMGEQHATGVTATLMEDDGAMYVLLGAPAVNLTEVASLGIATGALLEDGNVVNDIWMYEHVNDYDGQGVNSDPFHILKHPTSGKYYVVDSGANTILTFSEPNATEPDNVIVIPNVMGDAIPTDMPGPCFNVTPPMGPPFCGVTQKAGTWQYSIQAVPTAVRVRPGENNTLYFSTLTGALWNQQHAGIHKVDLDDNGIPMADTMAMVAGPFWAVVDFDFMDMDNLYVLETNPGSPFIPFSGMLSHVDISGSTATITPVETVDLVSPTGLIIHDNMIYISNNTYNFDVANCDTNIIMADLMGSMGSSMSPTQAPGTGTGSGTGNMSPTEAPANMSPTMAPTGSGNGNTSPTKAPTTGTGSGTGNTSPTKAPTTSAGTGTGSGAFALAQNVSSLCLLLAFLSHVLCSV